MTQNNNRSRPGTIGVLGLMAAMWLAGLVGCETDSWMDPSVVGRWEHTPVTMPILSRIDVIEPRNKLAVTFSPVTPEDLRPDFSEYTIGVSDVIGVIIFELVDPGQEAAYQRQVDGTGLVRLPFVGPIKAAGKTASQLEDHIAKMLDSRDIIRNATVSVIMQNQSQNSYTVVSSPLTGGTAGGVYGIPRPNFRLLDAIAMARGVPDRTQRLLVIRPSSLSPDVSGDIPAGVGLEGEEPIEVDPPAPQDPSDLIEELMRGMDGGSGSAPAPTQNDTAQAAPAGIESGLDSPRAQAQWVNVGGKWVRVGASKAGVSGATDSDNDARLAAVITQRVIEVPYDLLNEGDMRYNMIIRPGDIIRVPGQQGGFVYLGGAINRPGAYNIPGEKDLTLKQLVVSGGGLSAIAIPERTDLIRRIGNDQEATLRINLRAIFDGSEPDLFLKANDVINIGTNMTATPLAIVRNGLRATYGFGFVLDRNFNLDVFGAGQ